MFLLSVLLLPENSCAPRDTARSTEQDRCACAVQKMIEDPAAEMILSGKLLPDSTLVCDFSPDEQEIHLACK